MRQLGSIPQETAARQFVDYLLTLNVAAKCDHTGDRWEIWVHNEDQLELARREFQEFLAHPTADKYTAAVEEAQRLRRDEQQRDRAARKNYVELRTRWDKKSPGSVFVTWVLLGASCWLALQTGFGSTIPPELLIAVPYVTVDGQEYWSLSKHLQNGELWRLVTPIFLHFSPMHLLFNMMWTYDLGRRIEAQLGHWRFVLLVLVAAVLANLAQYFVTGPGFGGMSGVVYAWIGFAWVQWRYAGNMHLYLGPSGMFMAMAWLVLCFVGMLGDIANWAHLVGLLVGLAAGWVPIVGSNWRRRM